MKHLSVKEIITDLRKSEDLFRDEHRRLIRCGSSLRATIALERSSILEQHADAYAAGRLVNEELDK